MLKEMPQRQRAFFADIKIKSGCYGRMSNIGKQVDWRMLLAAAFLMLVPWAAQAQIIAKAE